MCPKFAIISFFACNSSPAIIEEKVTTANTKEKLHLLEGYATVLNEHCSIILNK